MSKIPISYETAVQAREALRTAQDHDGMLRVVLTDGMYEKLKQEMAKVDAAIEELGVGIEQYLAR